MTERTKDALARVGKITKQVNQHTGRMYHFNVDPISFENLQEAAQNLKELGTPVSYSVIVRRALRVYDELTKNLSDNQKIVEGYELLKASKGT
ncbi:MAG: hypothetical protein A4E59_00159 [Syntrophorhabdus sp. PtaB.Bin027]|nr:MAG: hypothetical protein A4E59_00159 [Syntrophorhabdus sp. PtaB.Bin027]OQB77775.1 MAG: hypothetical protein BWX92_00656 [Deltaproteobacteria bacterium ADurb.Bin135]